MKRVRVLVLFSCACLVSVAWGQEPTCGVYAPWAQFHKLNMKRWNPCEKVLNVDNVGDLGLKWSYAVGSINTDSSPAVSGGVVYVGSWEGNVYALKAGTGAKLWSYTTDSASVYSSPSVANLAAGCIPLPPSPMGWSTSAPRATTCTRSTD